MKWRLKGAMRFALAASSLGLFAAVPPMARARADVPWTVEGKLLGKPRDANVEDSKKSKDISGIACASDAGFPRSCLVVDDEAQGAQVLMVKERMGEAGAPVHLIDDAVGGKLVELDGEGVGYSEGAFYVIGSHGRPRHEDGSDRNWEDAKTKASRRIFRIRLAPTAGGADQPQAQIVPSSELPRFIMMWPELKQAFDRPLADNGLTIEGVAVRNGRLYAGMRGPVLEDGKAAVLSVPLDALFDGKQGKSELMKMDLGTDASGARRGVRDLASFGDGFLVLAGPEIDPPKGRAVATGDYSIYAATSTGVTRLADLKGYGAEIKPEALLPLDTANGRIRALILFDGADEGGGKIIEFSAP